ncbi:hypothetical protein [Streptomyces sp. NPDC007172]|uniref:hypothetical protein n=1 Tax=Streptomyces sp. NPDC007172 TaxID=3364776 RepID=UPI003681B159
MRELSDSCRLAAGHFPARRALSQAAVFGWFLLPATRKRLVAFGWLQAQGVLAVLILLLAAAFA